MCNYYEETMPLITNEEEYLKYYYEESLPIFDKLNSIIKKGQPFQRQSLLKNLLVYVKEPFFKSLINFIINDILTWDSETILLLPKALYILITNTDYILENELFNIIFKHMINSVSSGAEKSRNEYTFYFNKIIEFYSIIDIKNNNKIKKNFFPYTINDDIIEFIVSLGIFGQTTSNRKLCCFLSSSLCRIMIKINGGRNNLDDTNIKKLYERLSYLFWDGEKMIEGQMVRELLYIIPIFKDIMFTNEDIIQAIKSYINHDTDHIIQVMAIISVLKNIVYLNKEINIINVLFDEIKEIIEDFDYESLYKNLILHILVIEIYNNYLELNPAFIYRIFKLGIMKNYYNYYKLDIFFIKNFEKYFFLINYFLENAQYLQNKFYSNNENSKIDSDEKKNEDEIQEYQELAEQIQLHNFEEYFIKIYNELFLIKDNNNANSNNISILNENNEIEKGEELVDIDNINCINNDIIHRDYFINNNNKKYNINSLIFDEYYFLENIDIIFSKNENDNFFDNNFYNKEIIKKILILYLPKIISCFPNLKNNKTLCDKILSLFDKTNIIMVMNVYSSSLQYIEKNIDNNKDLKEKNKKQLKKHPLYELFLFLLKKNLKIYFQQSKAINKAKDKENKDQLLSLYEGNIYSKIIISILTNIKSIYQDTPILINNEIYILIGTILNLLLPKFFKYYKNITYNTVVNNNQNNNIININSSFVSNKETIKVCYFEKIYDELFNKFVSKIITTNTLGHHVIKVYIELIPYFILYSKNRWKYYEFFVKEILSSESYYQRKYSIIFFEKCFKIFSFEFLCKNGLMDDFIILMKDKINLISTNAIELLYKYNKKIISYSTEKFQELCRILNQIYDINIKAFNDNENKTKEILFDKEKNIIINKIISINNDVNKYYTEDEIKQEKEYEKKLLLNENEILKFSKSSIKKNISKNNIHNNTTISINSNMENNKPNNNILQLSSTTFHGSKTNSIINSNNYNVNKYQTPNISNKNMHIFNATQKEKEKNAKITPWIEKSSSCLFKDKKQKTNIILNSFNKESKYVSNDSNYNHFNSRYNSTSKSITYNKHYLPKLRDLKINRKDLDFINNNIRSIDITFNKINTKLDENEEKFFSNNIINANGNKSKNHKKEYNIDILSDKKVLKNEMRLISFTQNRIPSAKIKLMDSYPIAEGKNIYDEHHPDLYIKNYDNEKKTSTYNQSNLRCNYFFNNNSKGNSIYMRSISNKQINMVLRPNSKNIRVKRDNNPSINTYNKIYIDAGK
jgi:hypothetical protein